MYCSLMLLRRNCFLCTQCPKISVLLFNDGLDMRMESFSCRHSLHILSPGAYGFTFFIISHLMLKSVFFFFNFRTLCAQKTVSSQQHQRTIHTSRKSTTTAEIQYQPTTQSSEEGAERSFETLESRQ